jgi:hypothetical protein
MGSPDWMAFRQQQHYGYCRISIQSATELDWSFVATNPDGSKQVTDHTTIVQPEPSARDKSFELSNGD